MTQRVAIACSGLGLIRRGNENWAQTVAEALHSAGEPVTLFGAAPLETSCPYRRVATIPRESALWRRWISWPVRYRWEQFFFSAGLRRTLRPGHFDIIVAADPQLAWWVRNATRNQRPVTVYQDGLMLGPDWNWRFEWSQVLAPYYKEEAQQQGHDVTGWRVIPQMVDTDRFSPPLDPGEARDGVFATSIPPEALVILAVGDFSGSSNKRLDWILREVAAMDGQVPELRPHLVIAGHATPEALAGVEAYGRPLLGSRLHLVPNRPTTDMPALFRAADVFVHAALREPFGVVFIEAMACGIPVIAHTFPVSRWIVGDGGVTVDMTEPGTLSGALARLAGSPAERKTTGKRARRRALSHFSPKALVPEYRAFFREIRMRRGHVAQCL